MVRFPDPSGPARWLPIWLTVALGLLTSLAAYFSLPIAARPAASETRIAPAPPDSPVRAIILIHDEPDLPAGPHRDAFVARCTFCHSPRLVANQPAFPREKWSEVVHKMVTAYGAPVTPAQEPQIVDYLMTYRGR
ncbi:MAG: hypothetical protein ACHRXM_36725 [Isosphaerales bacterium]